MIRNQIINKIESLINIQNETFSDHSLNVSNYAYDLAFQIMKDYPELNLSNDFPENLKLSALIHDIGKLFIPIEILSKPNTLTEDEYFLIQKHSQYGSQLLEIVFCDFELNKEELELLHICHEVCLQHHERLDGSGYPLKNKKNEIPLSAQMIAIVDSFDAMTCDRCYKPSMQYKRALEILLKEPHKYNYKFLKSFEKVLMNNNII